MAERAVNIKEADEPSTGVPPADRPAAAHEPPPIDDVSVPPLTDQEDTKGG